MAFGEPQSNLAQLATPGAPAVDGSGGLGIHHRTRHANIKRWMPSVDALSVFSGKDIMLAYGRVATSVPLCVPE